MLTYECDEYQYVENIRRLIESTHDKIIVNRKITLHDDRRYRPSVLPAVEFVNYSGILDRKSLKSNVYLIKPFYDDFHKRRSDADEIIHSYNHLRFPRISVPYFRVEYSITIWGSS
jgi:hypothetical protein